MPVRNRLLCMGFLAGLLPAPLLAQTGVGLGVHASSLGIGPEVSLRLSPSLAVRGSLNALSFTRTEEVEGITYDLTPDLKNGMGMLDFFPFRSGFHLSGGLLFNKNELDLIAVASGPVTIGNVTYQPADIGQLDGNVTVNDLSPYLGIGFSGNGRVSLTFDLGVVAHGTPQLTLIGTTPLTGAEKATFDNEVAREAAEVQQAIDDEPLAKYYPMLAVGVRVRM